jgi:hypothetical protein
MTELRRVQVARLNARTRLNASLPAIKIITQHLGAWSRTVRHISGLRFAGDFVVAVLGIGELWLSC